MLVKDAKAIAAITNGNSKMPGSCYSQDSFACHVGSKLAQVKGSVCEGCYARRIQKMRPSVDSGWKRNLTQWRLHSDDPTPWIDAAAFQINRTAEKSGEFYHRWFDSGDLDSLDQLLAIMAVCYKTPKVKHWLPTREIAIVSAMYRAGARVPDNLVIRVSSPMVSDKPLSWSHTSTVHRKGDSPVGHVCPAPMQDNNCGNCRACWSASVQNVSYKKH